MESDLEFPSLPISKADQEEIIKGIDEVFGKLRNAISADSFHVSTDEEDANYHRSIKYFYDTVVKRDAVTPAFRRVLWDIDNFLQFSARLMQTRIFAENEIVPENLMENIEALRKVGVDLFKDTNRIDINMTLCFDFMRVQFVSLVNDDSDGNIAEFRLTVKVKRKLDSVNNLIQANKYRLQIYSSIRNTISHILFPN